MRPVNIHLIAAARPNFMKVAPQYHAMKSESWCNPILVHTGQHYDPEMSDVFLHELGLPQPDVQLGVGSGSHAQQTAAVMVAYEQVCVEHWPDWVVVVGDVNSTMACTLVAKKLCIPVAHLEAGLRSGDRTMPEEINRIVTDGLADLLWTPSEDADDNLRHEGAPDSRSARVGNIMIDSYEMLKEKIEQKQGSMTQRSTGGRYGVVTLHRPANVDHADTLSMLVDTLIALSASVPLVFPVHPRTFQRLEAFGLQERLNHCSSIELLKPLGYVEFMALVKGSAFVVTDSGGVQEETTYLGIPCLTVRESTERPVTVTQGTNRLIKPQELYASVLTVLEDRWPQGACPEMWDGRTAERVVENLKRVVEAG